MKKVTVFIGSPRKQATYQNEKYHKLKKRIMESIDLDDDPLKVVKKLMSLNVSGMAS